MSHKLSLIENSEDVQEIKTNLSAKKEDKDLRVIHSAIQNSISEHVPIDTGEDWSEIEINLPNSNHISEDWSEIKTNLPNTIQPKNDRVSFFKITKGLTYSRKTLANLWGYSGIHAIARGVVTPRGENKIILFVTEQKQSSAEQYVDHLSGNILQWEGPTDHFAETRMIKSESNDEIHLFYRKYHRSDFTYYGQLKIISQILHDDKPSQFTFEII